MPPYSLILMGEDSATLNKIDNLLLCRDILEGIGNIHPEEEKIFKQEYKKLRSELNFDFSIEEADRRIKERKYCLN